MKEYQFILRNFGMNRDLSVSKTGESSAYENVNIRITALDKDTLLSVTNERGTAPIDLTIEGELVGWNVLNNHIILFTHEEIWSEGSEPTLQDRVDYIYRIDYTPGETNEFSIVRGNKITDEAPLYVGYESKGELLGFDTEHPIESIVYAETDDIQKIYWVDGQHVLRFMNFMAELEQRIVYDVDGYPVQPYPIYLEPWEKATIVVTPPSHIVTSDNTFFDSNRAAQFTATCEISKDNSGNTRANGVVQYLLTYFNEHGQETGYVWISDLVYLSPLGRGGAADETNNNSITLQFSNLDTSFSHFRVYSVFRSSLNGQVVAYLVSEQHTTDGIVSVVDDGAHLTVQDTTRLLYLGSQPAIVSTMAHKDQTLFLGDLQSVGRNDYDAIEALIKDTANQGANSMYNTSTGESGAVEYVYSNSSGDGGTNNDIPYIENTGLYPYKNQLSLSSSQIQTFKGGEKYRFALKFQRPDGSETDAFWIGDKENTLYPVIDTTVTPPVIKRSVAKCTIPERLVTYLKGAGYATARLCIAEATYADRSVKAQGIVNPTMFNTWERYNNRVYAMPSWISRPRGSQYAFQHFAPTMNANTSKAEIQCNYWGTEGNMVPYFQYKNYTSSSRTYVEKYEGAPDYSHIMLVYSIFACTASFARFYDVSVYIIKGKVLISSDLDNTAETDMLKYMYTDGVPTDWEYVESVDDNAQGGYYHLIKYSDVYFDNDGKPAPRFELKMWKENIIGSQHGNRANAVSSVYYGMANRLVSVHKVPQASIVSYGDSNLTIFSGWCSQADSYGGEYYFNINNTASSHCNTLMAGLTFTNNTGADRWFVVDNSTPITNEGERTPAYWKKHIMFVDENTVTLNSPEFAYEAIDIDNEELKFQIVGVAKMSSVMSDYVIDATNSPVSGTNYEKENFSGSINDRDGNLNGILTWPLWKDFKLSPKQEENQNESVDDKTKQDYNIGSGSVTRYWLYLWQHSGIISGYSDSNDTVENKTSVLQSKIFANLRFSYNSIYLSSPFGSDSHLPINHPRLVNEFSHSYNALRITTENKYYESVVELPLTMPGQNKYPIYFSNYRPDNTFVDIGPDEPALSSNAPILLTYRQAAHAVFSFETNTSGTTYKQTILPYIFDSDRVSIPAGGETTTGALIPWIDTTITAGSSYRTYDVKQEGLTFSHDLRTDSLSASDQYLFIGELYKDFSANDTRYGGISEAAIQNNRFIAAGPACRLDDMETTGTVFGNQGDTYFQRWDCLRTKPYSEDAENKVIDITSFMVETHINLDGRSDLYRGMPELASMNLEQFGQLNRVYSQQDNFSVRRDLDSDFNTDAYRSSITWTLPKSDMADVDEWTHITLASTLKLDSDKGICRALRRFNNGIVAFQDRAISEVLFNSMTPLSTTDSVPVEIANSGKVDGKRYVSNKYGCVNKWSISEGKGGLYFVDNINKAFCSFNYAANGKAAIDNLSEKLSFGVWFREGNTLKSWTPVDYDNIVSYYDKVHQDVYLVKKEGTELEPERYPSLVFNEILGRFTSFYDYGSVPMMANVEDKFISFHGSSLWKMGEGRYCNFFGQQYPFSVQYRVTPEPYGDKIWTNVEYRADVYKVLGSGDGSTTEAGLTDSDLLYQPNKTFDYFRFWNEYQTTDDTQSITPTKKFRIWRLQIPRAKKNEQFNKYGLDRIRNPWLNLLFKQTYGSGDGATTNDELVQLHDITVKYFE